jgi:hypothetical protein
MDILKIDFRKIIQAVLQEEGIQIHQ